MKYRIVRHLNKELTANEVGKIAIGLGAKVIKNLRIYRINKDCYKCEGEIVLEAVSDEAFKSVFDKENGDYVEDVFFNEDGT